MARTYKLRAVPNGARSSDGSRYHNYSMTVPPEIAKAVPEGMEFECVMDEDGIHYRPVTSARTLPSWATGEPAPAEAEKPKRQEPVRA
jgi:hypothetical protein